MINNNKILTVSYGTFSCTLEGFDDSFGTMKAIAEYFRDLSADDRYFGAEPVQPDAQMLARIAEREISRHVEAREDKGRIVLSAQSAPQKAAALVAADAVDDVAEAIAEAAVAKADQQAADTDAEANNAETDAALAEPLQAKASSVRIKVTPQATAPKSTTVEQAKSAPSEDEAAAASATAKTEPAAERDIVPSLPDEDVEAFFAETATATEAGTVDQDDFEDIESPEENRAKADSIADKLKRIRAVVSQQGDAIAAPDYSEDQHADATVAPASRIAEPIADEVDAEEDETNDVLADTLRDLEDALDADDEMETSEKQVEEESEDDDIAAILNRLESEAGTSDVTEDRDEEDFDDEFENEFNDDDDFIEDEDEDDGMEGNILSAMDSIEAGSDSQEEAVSDDAQTDENLFEDEVEEGAAQPVATPVRPAPRTRVLKVKRATLEAAIQSGQIEEYDDEEDDADEAEAAPLRKAPLASRSSLSAEAEEALARELAELEADMAAEDTAEDDTEAYDETEDDAPIQSSVAARARINTPADEDFSRLMEESEQQMEEPEAATRRDAFAHLRAAVAAKKADEAVAGPDEAEETDEAYRDDLASVVRPRRPVSGERSRTERPTEQRPAPLKLVAEQRIDTGITKTAGPVRPRRVAALATQTSAPHSSLQANTETEGFADFAEQMGASKLPDLLEAAAAYLSFVEGHEQFSRPQLMTKVRQVEKENFTREDSLRSFGKLLREGKIEKMKGGRFQASDQIGFKPAKRAAG